MGKIVVFNEPYVGYGSTVSYRVNGAVAAQKCGGLAALVRSVTPFSIYSPHTGGMSYSSNTSIPRIATAAITVEDAQTLARMQARNETIKLFLNISTRDDGYAISRNLVADLPGTTYPNEVFHNKIQINS